MDIKTIFEAAETKILQECAAYAEPKLLILSDQEKITNLVCEILDEAKNRRYITDYEVSGKERIRIKVIGPKCDERTIRLSHQDRPRREIGDIWININKSSLRQELGISVASAGKGSHDALIARANGALSYFKIDEIDKIEGNLQSIAELMLLLHDACMKQTVPFPAQNISSP